MEAVDVNKAILAIIDINGKTLAKLAVKFSAGKMKLLSRINEFLGKNCLKLSDISGIIAVTGTGSFTSIRTSLSIVNTWANIMSIPAVGFSRQETASFEDLIKKGIVKLRKTKHSKIFQPFYGGSPDITIAKRLK